MARRSRPANLPEGDDGRTIVNMNVEGMPWYRPERPDAAQGASLPDRPQADMTRDEGRVFLWGAVKAALLVVGVISAGMVLFVLFCQHVWFRT